MRRLRILRQSLHSQLSRQMSHQVTASFQTKVPRTIRLVRLRSYMFYIYHDFIEDNYLLFETVNGITAFIYRDDSCNFWMSFCDLLTAVPVPDSEPENYVSLKKSLPDYFTLLYSARTLPSIHKFILDHPELAI